MVQYVVFLDLATTTVINLKAFIVLTRLIYQCRSWYVKRVFY